MTKIALLGAGGKMGVRLATNLVDSRFEVDHVEISAEGRQRLKSAIGVECVDQDKALAQADVVLMAVPDRLIGKIAHGIVDKVRPGTALIVLDAAAPHAGQMPDRPDLTYFVTHPCHPPIFNDETTEAAKKDFFGGIAAKQHIVCALMQGPEEHYALCEEVARTIYKPVMTAHRCTVEQIAILEPALSETVAITLCIALREAVDEVARQGVPRQAAVDFLFGHLTIGLSIAFEIFPEGRFSDGALHAIEQAKPQIFREGWLDRVFAPEAVLQSVKDICDPGVARAGSYGAEPA
jgi:D-apionate oxidoisomerase